MWRIYLLISVVSMMVATAMIGCSKSDVQIAIEATKEAEQTAEAKEVATFEAIDALTTATSEADDAYARSMIEQYCDAIEARFKTDRAMPAITMTRMFSAKEWILLNADINSEISDIVFAFEYDLERTQNGDYASWADAFQKSGSKYVADCKTASWKR